MAKQKLHDFLEDSWDNLIVDIPHDTDTHLGLPHPFVAPSVQKTDGFVFKEQFYWDSYFVVVALNANKRQELAKNMVENLLFLQEKLGYVPNSNNRAHLGRSQPPMLALMVKAIGSKDKAWLERAYKLLVNEHKNVWLASTHPHARKTQTGLSRYYHEDQSHRGAEDESGWDYTTRFNDCALDFNPIDLNSILYQNEVILADLAAQLGLEKDEAKWRKKAKTRLTKINKYMWDEDSGCFVDYNYAQEQKSTQPSLAMYMTMFCGLATTDQAARMTENLSMFETDYGLTTTPKTNEPADGKQWASPNGWAPLHYIVVEGLESYGFKDEAKRIKHKWLELVSNKYTSTGVVYEKYNVVNPDQPAVSAVYPDQIGFAWTNAVTQLFLNSRYYRQ